MMRYNIGQLGAIIGAVRFNESVQVRDGPTITARLRRSRVWEKQAMTVQKNFKAIFTKLLLRQKPPLTIQPNSPMHLLSSPSNQRRYA